MSMSIPDLTARMATTSPNFLELRGPEDAERFRFDAAGRIERIPFPDDMFDFIYSASVFEHVQNQEQAWREIHRVLKPGGASLHNFPARWRPIEPHRLVPFGGAIKAYGWYRFWAALGVRNRYQKGWSPAETARDNARYAAQSLNYLGVRRLDRLLRGIFREVTWAELSFLRHSPGPSRRLYPWAARLPGVAALFRALHTRILLLRK